MRVHERIRHVGDPNNVLRLVGGEAGIFGGLLAGDQRGYASLLFSTRGRRSPSRLLVGERGGSSPFSPWFFPWPFSISFSSSPARCAARAERTAQPAHQLWDDTEGGKRLSGEPVKDLRAVLMTRLQAEGVIKKKRR